ncbi:MAG: hypothetical protein HZC42_09625 [Candidatus Eisenbacteria bacterium]|nr:hypothetical protein [Candidatus Eisenbacteria bacterium]
MGRSLLIRSAAALCAVCAALPGPQAVRAASALPVAAAADSMRVRLESGMSADVSNEQFYEDAFTDTTFLGRRLVSTPETRYAAVLYAGLDGTRAARRVRYQLHNELSYGDRLQRDALDLAWVDDFAPAWRFFVAPRAEYRRDQTFGRDLEEWRSAARLRLRRSFGDGMTFAELGGAGELLRSSGQGADFILDRDAGTVSGSLERAGLTGSDWRAGYSFSVRSFPDSSERNHLEHGWEARWRQEFGPWCSLTLESDGSRRATVDLAPTSRDNFWQERGAVEIEINGLRTVSWHARVEGEALQYDVEDNTLFFDSRLWHARLSARLQTGAAWSLEAGPRGERLSSPREVGESYDEIGGAFELESLAAHAWWSVTPAAGWRAYEPAAAQPGVPALPGLHSDFAFYEVTVLGDQPLPGALRFRVSGTARLEAHTDSSQDARSLYFSFDLRRLF